MNDKYGDSVQIMLFPCNQFGRQEPWPETQIVEWAQQKFGIVDGSGINFFQKADVNGPNTQPAWTFFKQVDDSDVSWNFAASFVLNKKGQVVGRYSRFADIERTIEEELSKSPSFSARL